MTLAENGFIMGNKKEKNGLEHVESTDHVLRDVGMVSGAVTDSRNAASHSSLYA